MVIEFGMKSPSITYSDTDLTMCMYNAPAGLD